MTLPILIVSNLQFKLMLTVAKNKETKQTTYLTAEFIVQLLIY